MVEYAYDSWGKLVSTTGTLATTLGANNPFRYRGYYYDAETGLYYLQTRYYDPEVCRFISADVYMSTGQGITGNNMFAYCGNNPGIHVDSKGCETQIIPTWVPPESYGWLAAALGVAGPALLLVGMVLAIPLLCTASSAQVLPIAQTVEQEKEVEIDISRIRRLPSDVFIYRTGNDNYTTLTPRAKDVEGLSFTTKRPTGEGYFMTTIKTVNKTGVLTAVLDGVSHVSVRPSDMTQMPLWIASRPAAKEFPHPYSILLKSICMRIR